MDSAFISQPVPSRFLSSFACILFLSGVGWSAVEPPELLAAAQAMRDKLPDVAISKLERFLAGGKANSDLLTLANLRLAEACVRAGKFEKALEVTKHTPSKPNPDLAFWRGTALQAMGRYTEALEVYATLPEDPEWSLFRELLYNRAASLSAVGDFAGASKVLEPLVASSPEPRPHLWQAELMIRQNLLTGAETVLEGVKGVSAEEQCQQAFLFAKLRLEQGKFSEAVAQLIPWVESKQPRDLHQAVLLLLARSQRLAGDRSAAAATLAVLIQEIPDHEFLHAVFREFQTCNTPPIAEMVLMLVRWTESPHLAVKLDAILALADAREAEGDLQEALRLSNEFLTSQPQSPLTASVLLRQSRLLIRLERTQQALALLKPLQDPAQPAELRAYAAGVQAYAEVREGNFRKASEAFKMVSDATPDPEKKLVAVYQAALAAVSAEDAELGEELLGALSAEAARPLLADFSLERGLYAAAQGSAKAQGLLQKFLDRHPEHPRAFAAALAVAEASLQDVVSAPEIIRSKILVAEEYAKTDEQRQQVEVLSLHLDSINATPEAFAKKADVFLTAHPESMLRGDLLMKMAVRFYNTQQYAPAKVRFLQIVEEEPESALVETALYWAGKAALGSLAKGCEDEAIKLWDRVAAGKGVLQMEARLEQAKLNQRRNPAAALQLFEVMLKAQPALPPNLKYTVLCLRGETLMAVAGEDVSKISLAVSDFDQVIVASDSSLYWKQQALVRKGACLENLKDDTAALEAYTEAMKLTQLNLSTSETDYHWFFRAGDKARRLLESKKKWEAAVLIARKMAEAPGPQADAARDRANRLTTEHFLWDDD